MSDNKNIPEFLQMTKGIRPFITLDIAVRNLLFKKLRTSLTILGVVIGVGAIFFLVSLGLGLKNLVTKDVVGSTSVKSITVTSINSTIVNLTQENVNAISNYAHVEDVGVSYSFAASAGLEGAESDAVVFGVDEPYYNLTNVSLVEGSHLLPESKSQVIVNTAFVKAIGIENPEQVINKEISLLISAANSNGLLKEDQLLKLTVVGVFESGTGSEIFVPSNIFDSLGVPYYYEAKVIADNTENISQIRQQIEAKGFRTESPIDTLNEINRAFNIFNLALAVFGSIGMIVAVLGMFNTLTISLLERTQEVGLMMALGSRRRDIRRLFTIEAWLLAFTGGFIGIIGAAIFATTINVLTNASASSRGLQESFSLFSFPFWLILLTLIFTTAIGIIVSYMPAKRASQVNPIDALRND